jgi:hypothetical protein
MANGRSDRHLYFKAVKRTNSDSLASFTDSAVIAEVVFSLGAEPAETVVFRDLLHPHSAARPRPMRE